MNTKKQLKCELNCKATAQLKVDVEEEMNAKDKSLADILQRKIDDEVRIETKKCD